MKRLVFLIVCLFITSIGFAQQTTITYIEYIYDAAGNRIHRNVIVIIGKNSDATADSTKYTEPVVDRLNDLKILVYPNPTAGLLKMVIEHNSSELPQLDLFIYSNEGKLIRQQNAIGIDEEIDFSGYSPGMYIMRMSDGTNYREWKIIRQ